MKVLAAMLALAGGLACASSGPPPAETVTRVDVSTGVGTMGAAQLHNEPGSSSHTLPLPSDSVWRALPVVYGLLGIDGAGAVPEQRVYGVRGFRPRRFEDKRLSNFIDCGMGRTATPNADEYEVTMTLLSRVQPAGDAAAVLETVMEASGRPRAVSGNRVSCQSNGTLEARVAELVAWVLASGR